jgi:hypothetical protein
MGVTNRKGTRGLIKVIDNLCERNYHCFTPFDDYCAVDLIALTQTGKTVRLQVKYRELTKRGSYELSARSIVNGKSVPIDKNLIDGWAIYLADIDKVVYMHVSAMDGKSSHNLHPDKLDDLAKLEDW